MFELTNIMIYQVLQAKGTALYPLKNVIIHKKTQRKQISNAYSLIITLIQIHK